MTISIRDVSKQISGGWPIKDLSFETRRGEIFGIFSSEPLVQSLLFDLIAGVAKPDSGEILIGSEDISRVSNYDAKIHYPDKAGPSGLKKFLGSKKDSSKKDGFEFLSLDLNAEIFLINSRFSALERRQKDQKITQLKEFVKNQNCTVLFATTDFEEIFTICDRVAVFVNGTIARIGTPREVYEYPNSIAVSRAGGRNNVIPARRISSSKSESPKFVTISGEHQLFTGPISKQDLAPINQDINLAIRPEHISISFGASFPEDNLLKAAVVDIQYLGATTLIHLNASGLILKALVLRLVGLNIGDECMVGLPPDRLYSLKH